MLLFYYFHLVSKNTLFSVINKNNRAIKLSGLILAVLAIDI